MITHDDFWLLLHDLATAISASEKDPQGRARMLERHFQGFPPPAKNQVGEDLDSVLSVLLELRPLIHPSTPHSRTDPESKPKPHSKPPRRPTSFD